MGAYVFGEEALAKLRRAEELWDAQREVVSAVREQLRTCEQLIAEYKAAVDRIDRLLDRHGS
jgi:hypothetical protein